ncbi:MAG: Ig-like domain repeat protein [Acidobacteriaceae bacterium]
MSSKSSMSLRRFSVIALTLLLVGSICLGGAQAQTAPVVTASFAQGLNHPSGWGLIEQTAVDSYGDWLIVDDANGALYEFPAGGGAEVTLVPAGILGGGNNPGIAIDASNNLYLEGNWSNCLLAFPYDTATHTWDGLATLTGHSPSSACAAPYDFAQYGLVGWNWGFQPWGIAAGPNNTLVIANQTDANFLFTLTVNGSGATATAGTPTEILDTMTVRASSVAEDTYGNIYFVEEPPPASSGGLPGVYMVPVGESGLASDTDPSIVRVDPNLPSVTGVTTDANGNLYISDSTEGVFMVPNVAGTPTPSAAVLLTSIPATGQVSIDWMRHILYIPTNQKQSNGQADVAEVVFNAAEFGAVTLGGTAAQQSVSFAYSASATPASLQIVESGAANPDFFISSGGTCTTGTAYVANSSCSVNVTFNPHSAGSVSAKLLMLDGSGNVLASMRLHGTGTSAAVQFVGGAQSVIGAGLKTPGQVAVDAGGNVYVADSGLGAVEEYPQVATTTVGTGLTAPTGVAVDGAGDVFIADTGSVYEVPFGGSGLNAAGQMTLKTGLGSNLKLAVDGWGNLYILDPDNKRVVELANPGGTVGPAAQGETDVTGFNTPSALAVDANGNLFVADGSNLDEIAAGSTTIATVSGIGISGATGLAVDASGSVYVSMTGGTIRIPNESGTLTQTDATTIATNVTAPASVAVDAQGDVYVADATALNVNATSASASYNFGTQATPTGTTSQTFTLLNNGNTALNVTGFSSTADYSATATDCTGTSVSVDATCIVTVTFNPGSGNDGTLIGAVQVQGNVANVVGVNGTGVGYALALSTTTITAGATATTDDAPITVAVTSTTAGTLTGEATLTVSGNGITPITMTEPIASGMAQFDPQNLTVGSYTFAVTYSGDRAYEHSSSSLPVTIAAGAVTMTQPSSIPPQFPSFTMPQSLQSTFGSGTGYLVVCQSTGCNWVYSDGSDNEWTYTYPVTVTAANGSPLTCTPVYENEGTPPAPTLVRENCGSVTYTVSSGHIGCPSTEPPVSADQVDVSSTNGSAPLQAGMCLEVDDSNTTRPDLMTFYTVTPSYNGTDFEGDPANPNYASFTGTPINFWAVRNPVVQISSSAPSLSVAAGSSTSTTLTLTSELGYGYLGRGSTLNNYSTPLDLQCSGLPAYASCSFAYSAPIASDPNQVGVLCPGSTTQYCDVNVGPTPGTTFGNGTICEAADGCIGPGSVVMTINTNVPVGTQTSSLRTDRASLAFAAMFGLGLLGLGFRKKARRWGGWMLLACVALCGGGMVGITACGTTNLTPANENSSVTPAGTYTVTVTAKEAGFVCVYNTNPGHATVSPCPAGSSDQPTWGNANQMSLPYTINVTISK